MGSKMAAATRVVQVAQVVKPHTPLIKFPDRTSIPKPIMQESSESRVPPLHHSASQRSLGSQPLSFQNISSISRAQGAPDTSELLRTFPMKYRRKPMSVEEMEYIQDSPLLLSCTPQSAQPAKQQIVAEHAPSAVA